MRFKWKILKFKRWKKVWRIWNPTRSLRDKLWKKLRTSWVSMITFTCQDWEILKSIRKSFLTISNKFLKMQNSSPPCSEQKPLSELNAKLKRMKPLNKCLWLWSSTINLCQKEMILRMSWRESKDWPFKLLQLEEIWNNILMNPKLLTNKPSKELQSLSWKL